MKCLPNCGKCCVESYIAIQKTVFETILERHPEYDPTSLDYEDYGFLVCFYNGCGFLKEDKTCGIYPDRPNFCRCFPFIMDGREIKVSSECPALHTVERKDVFSARKWFSIDIGLTTASYKKYAREHGERKAKKMSGKFIEDVKKFGKEAPGDMCYWIPWKEFFKLLPEYMKKLKEAGLIV